MPGQDSDDTELPPIILPALGLRQLSQATSYGDSQNALTGAAIPKLAANASGGPGNEKTGSSLDSISIESGEMLMRPTDLSIPECVEEEEEEEAEEDEDVDADGTSAFPV